MQVFARNYWIPPTAQNTKVNFTAKFATRANSDLKAMALAAVLVACQWTPVITLKARTRK